MKALILNSGLGRRMGRITDEHPKCMTEIGPGKETILSRQLRQLSNAGIKEIVMTTGYREDLLKGYCASLGYPVNIEFVNNPEYDTTNYIYSIYCARRFLEGDIISLHGDLVFEDMVLEKLLDHRGSAMTVSSAVPIPKKDFKAQIESGHITAVSVDIFNKVIAAQPLYKLDWEDWTVWMAEIVQFCDKGMRNVYAENAFNEISAACQVFPLDVGNMLCAEIDNPEDLEIIKERLLQT